MCKKELGTIFKSFFYNKKRENDETFFELYINSCFKSIPEFDFAFFTSFLGIFPLKGCGFFISSIIFTILNSALFIGFTKFDFEKEKHDGDDPVGRDALFAEEETPHKYAKDDEGPLHRLVQKYRRFLHCRRRSDATLAMSCVAAPRRVELLLPG